MVKLCNSAYWLIISYNINFTLYFWILIFFHVCDYVTFKINCNWFWHTSKSRWEACELCRTQKKCKPPWERVFFTSWHNTFERSTHPLMRASLSRGVRDDERAASNKLCAVCAASQLGALFGVCILQAAAPHNTQFVNLARAVK